MSSPERPVDRRVVEARGARVRADRSRREAEDAVRRAVLARARMAAVDERMTRLEDQLAARLQRRPGQTGADGAGVP